MAKMRIALGAEADICTTDEMHDGMRGLGSEIVRGLSHAKPVMRPLAVSLVGTGATLPKTTGDTAILKLGRPNSGRIWVVTRITVIGDDDHTVPTNVVAGLYIGDAAQASLSQLVQHAQAIPFTTLTNEKSFVVHDREDMFVGFTATGATTNTQLIATAIAWEYPDSAIDAQVI